MWTRQLLCQTTMPPPRPSRVPLATPALTPYWPRPPRYPVVETLGVFVHALSTVAPSDQRSVNLLRVSPTFLR